MASSKIALPLELYGDRIKAVRFVSANIPFLNTFRSMKALIFYITFCIMLAGLSTQSVFAQKYNSIRCKNHDITFTAETDAEDFRSSVELSDDGNIALLSSSFLRSKTLPTATSGFYLWDRSSKESTLVSILLDGTPAPIETLGEAAMSGDGKTVVFITSVKTAPQTSDDVRYDWEIFVRDVTQATTRSLVKIANLESSKSIYLDRLSRDGKILSWSSYNFDFFETTVVDTASGASAILPGGGFRSYASMFRDGVGYSLSGSHVRIPGFNAGIITRIVNELGVASFSFISPQTVKRRPGELITTPRGDSKYMSLSASQGTPFRRDVSIRTRAGNNQKLFTAADTCTVLATSGNGNRSILSCVPIAAKLSSKRSDPDTLIDSAKGNVRCYVPNGANYSRLNQVRDSRLNYDGSVLLVTGSNFGKSIAFLSFIDL